MDARIIGKTGVSKDAKNACNEKLTPDNAEDKFFVKVKCKVKEVKSVFGGKKAGISPQKATYIIVIIDICVCIGFIIATSLLIRFTKRDLRLADAKAIQLTDFAVLIKNIPKHDTNVSSEIMKAKLGIYLSKLV